MQLNLFLNDLRQKTYLFDQKNIIFCFSFQFTVIDIYGLDLDIFDRNQFDDQLIKWSS